MAGFKFEDYRQPWETGPHWELKQEFMEKYSDMFEEDRLLCLAQAYSNIVLMNCSYPEPVMRQISLLSEPLIMRKRFQVKNESSTAETPQTAQQREKIKSLYQNSGRPFKQVKFCSSQDTLETDVLPEPTVQHIHSTQPALTIAQESTQPQPKPILTVNNNQNSVINFSDSSNVSSNHKTNSENKSSYIVDTLGLEFIQQFIQKVRTFQVKLMSPLAAIVSAAQSLKIHKMIDFQFNIEPNCPHHAPIYCCKLSIKNCLISTEKAGNKKNAKSKSAESAVDILIKLSNHTQKPTQSADQSSVGELFAKDVAVKNLVTANNSVKDENDVKEIPMKLDVSETGQHIQVKHELKECLKNNNMETSLPSNPESNMIVKSKDTTDTKSVPFILNKSLFNSSMSDGFVLVHNTVNKIILKNFKNMLTESATYCKKSFEYNIDEMLGTPKVNVQVLIGNVVVGTGVGTSKEEAKTNACNNAVEMLRKKYYTLQLKNSYSDNCTIHRDQAFTEDESSNSALGESNIGCKMLKNMGWTGGGLGDSGIAEPIEISSQHGFGIGLGFKQGDNHKVFQKRINSILMDFSRSNSFSDLIFSKEFSKDERKDIHKTAARYGLHTGSRGIDSERILVVRRKYTATQVLEYLEKVGGSSSKFELVDASNDELNPFKISCEF